MINLFLATTRKRKFKLLLITILEFSFSFIIIQYALDNYHYFFKKIFETNQLIGFLVFWIFLSYIRGRYLLTGTDNIFLKSLKDIKEITIVSSIVLIFTFILTNTTHYNPYIKGPEFGFLHELRIQISSRILCTNHKLV